MFAGGSVLSESLMQRRLLWCCKGGRGSLRFIKVSDQSDCSWTFDDSSSLKIVHGAYKHTRCDGFEVAHGVRLKS